MLKSLHILKLEYIYSTQTKGTQMTQMNAKIAIAKAAKGEITLLDVREANELLASGKARDALHIPLALIPLQATDKINKLLPVAVYCAAGGRAGMAAQALQNLGYDAHNIGGFGDWASAGGPISH
jgi:rhodanese-related sulfurtransferase